MRAFECPLCGKVITPVQIFLHLIHVHGFSWRIFDEYKTDKGVLVEIRKREDEEPEKRLLFKAVNVNKYYKRLFADKFHHSLESFMEGEDVRE